MVPAWLLMLWSGWRARAKARAAEAADRVVEYRYQPPGVTWRGALKIALVLLATHGYVWWTTKRHALADFAAKAEAIAAKVRKKDAAMIAKLEREIRLAREAEDAALETAKQADAKALAEIEEILRRTGGAGWNEDVVRAINGDRQRHNVRITKGARR